MIRAGFTIENSLTGSRVIVLEGAEETGGMGWLLEHHAQPHARPDLGEHLHQTWTEKFEILSGTAYYRLDHVKKIAQAGETIIVNPGHAHQHPWNAGETELVFRQRDVFDRSTPQAVYDVLGVFATNADLTRAGKSDKRGQPRDPLQLAVELRTFQRYGGYATDLPIPVQDFIALTLGNLAALLGYKAVDPRYR